MNLAEDLTGERELLLLAFLPLIGGAMAFYLFSSLSQPWNSEPHGLTYHLIYGSIAAIGLPTDTAFVLPIGFVIGLVVLLLFDDFKRVEGVILILMLGLGAVAMYSNDVLITKINWFAQLPNLSVGILAGGAAGGGFSLFKSKRKGLREFPRVMTIMFWASAVVVVLGVMEAHLAYQSPIVSGPNGFQSASFQFQGITGRDMPVDVAVGTMFLGVVFFFTQYDKSQDIVIVGPSRSGKTTMMTGMNYSVIVGDDEIPAQSNEALNSLTEELQEDQYITGTQQDEVAPLQFSFKHGKWFPRKVTVRTIDYAGENVSSIEPRETADETATGSIDEAMDVALRLAWEDPNLDLVEKTGDEKGIDPTEYEQLENKNSNNEIAIELVQDVLYYSDMVAFVLPLDDFADPIVQRGTAPSYLQTSNGAIDSIGGRDSVSEYKSKYNDIARTYGVGGQDDEDGYDGRIKDMFFIASLADLVKEDYVAERGTDPVHDWDDFSDYVASVFIGDRFVVTQNHIGNNNDPQADIHPVYFEPANNQATDFTNLEFDIHPREGPPLRGTDQLLERVGTER